MRRYIARSAQVRTLAVGLVVLVGLAGASVRPAWLGGLVHAASVVNFTPRVVLPMGARLFKSQVGRFV
jgi:hypothetical protein